MINRNELLKKLISFKTVNPPGEELELCEYLAEVLEGIGFKTTVQKIDNNRGNVIAEIGPDISETSLMLTGHVDVVGVDSGWNTDPFLMVEKDNKLYGRGTCDMKGAIAAMISAAWQIIDSGAEFKNKLVLGFTADEEITGSGTRAMLASGVKTDYAVIGEPTMMNVAVAHRGVDRNKIIIEGRAGHASAPQCSLNPIYVAAKILSNIEEKQDQLQNKTHFILPPPTIAATIVKSGVQGNVIPQICEIVMDRRTIPGEDRDFIQNEINELINLVLDEYSGYNISVEHDFWLPATEPEPNSKLDKLSHKLLTSMNIDSQIRDFPAGCDQYQFTNAGIETILVGPGDIEQAHTANEYVTMEQIDKAEEFYKNLIVKLLF